MPKRTATRIKTRRPPAYKAAVLAAVLAVVVGGYLVVRTSHAAVQTIPVYRMANWITHERLFTTSVAEKNNALANYKGWVDEGTDFYAVPSTYTGAVPVYRMANYITHERLFTTSAAEKNNAVANYPGWVDEGIDFYEVPSTDATAIPVYRLANYITHERLFTLSPVEKNNALSAFPGWVTEGIGFYSAPGPATPTPSVSATPTPSGVPGGVTLRPIDGGTSYYASKNARGAWMDQHILLGAWYENPMDFQDVAYDAATGDNMYWNLSGDPTVDCGGAPCRADNATIRSGGMHVSAPDYFTSANDKMESGATNTNLINGSETVSFEGTPEPDMVFGAGWDNYDPNAYDCVPPTISGGKCGYSVANWDYTGQPAVYGPLPYPFDGSAVNQTFGKGVLFWETNKDAAPYMNFSDTLSADSFWMTDSDLDMPSQGGCALFPNSGTICGGGNGSGLSDAQRQLPANYEYNVSHLQTLQALNGSSKPAAVYVETGCPGYVDTLGNDACITPPAMKAAAMHGLIAGARGVVWFQHNFGGNCFDDRTIMDGSYTNSTLFNCQQTPGVTLHNMVQNLTAFNGYVNSLNSVLLAPFADGYATTTADVSVMSKFSGGHFYIFAGAGKPGVPPANNLSATFTIKSTGSASVTVVGENRTLPISGGTTFTDTFADQNAYHVYEVN